MPVVSTQPESRGVSKQPSHLVLDLRKVCKQYGSDPPVNALVDVDLKVRRGDWLAITGPSGAGKSTLLNIIGCLDHPTRGTYLLDGIDTAALTDGQRTGLRSRRIGFVFQAFHLLPYRTVLENVTLADVYRKTPVKGREERAREALDRVGLSHRVNFSPVKLSGGERQRVAIARALVGNPSLLLCDEPTGNLDSKSTESILQLFERLNEEGLTLVVVTHEHDVAERAKREVHIIDGKLTEDSPQDPATDDVSDTLPPKQKMPKSGIRFRDLVDEALAGMFARPMRTLLTVLGVVIGLTALVATLGLSTTNDAQIISTFNKYEATGIYMMPRPGIENPHKVLPWDAPERLRKLNGVVAAGSMAPLGESVMVSARPRVNDPDTETRANLSVFAASPGLFDAVHGILESGRLLDASLDNHRVAVLGPYAAEQLKIPNLEHFPAIRIAQYRYMVVGILKDVRRKGDKLLSAVIIPQGIARKDFHLAGPSMVVINTRMGAAKLIAQQAPAAVRPDLVYHRVEDQKIKVEEPQGFLRAKEDVQQSLRSLFLALGGLSLVVGAIGVANITLVSVMERTAEIGLRRAIGATRLHIATQFLMESSTLGIAGGILGASLGILIVVGVSAACGWTPVLDPLVPLLTPVVGALVGLVSGTYPAMRAARLEPVEAFRK